MYNNALGYYVFFFNREYGDICPLLDVDDMVKMKKPDWKCVFTYVQSFYRRFRNGRDGQSPTKVLFSQQQQQQSVRSQLGGVGGQRSKQHEYVLRGDNVVQPFDTFKNFAIKPLPKTSFGQPQPQPQQQPLFRPQRQFNRALSLGSPNPMATPTSCFNNHYKFPFSRINSEPANIVNHPVNDNPVNKNASSLFSGQNRQLRQVGSSPPPMSATPPNTPTALRNPSAPLSPPTSPFRRPATPPSFRATPPSPFYTPPSSPEFRQSTPGPRPATPTFGDREKRQRSLPPMPRQRPPPPPPINV